MTIAQFASWAWLAGPMPEPVKSEYEIAAAIYAGLVGA